MPFRYLSDESEAAFVCIGEGQVSQDDIRACRETIDAERRETPVHLVLDLRAVDHLAADADTVRAVAERTSLDGLRSVSVVAGGLAVFGLGRMLMTLCEMRPDANGDEAPVPVSVFRDMAAAKDWIATVAGRVAGCGEGLSRPEGAGWIER
ncbi:STAS/SEC14 domain-containing protein [Oceanibacterium hippocampi]|uniref:STAS/SEC14 domain-containing protein n=1 Tax=Oceanibacterium hippocampi TaxID=745714 RepID=A0A1Y5S1Q8_9PROT|nr:STAS/SEC14 domain-containing protein [Oceanibacterium hippocampi]SLN30470.1 hypothetical protein OCH7691_01063 [Oceanibacterium hippocampi]